MRTDREYVVGVLVGENDAVSRAFLLGAVALALLAAVVEAFVQFARLVDFASLAGAATPLFALVAVVAVLAAGANGYFNDGVLVGAVVALAPLGGVAGVRLLVPATTPLPGGGDLPTLVAGAAVVGTLAALAGAALGRVSAGPDREAAARRVDDEFDV